MSHSQLHQSSDDFESLEIEPDKEKKQAYKLPLGVRVALSTPKLGDSSSKSNDSLDSGVLLRLVFSYRLSSLMFFEYAMSNNEPKLVQVNLTIFLCFVLCVK